MRTLINRYATHILSVSKGAMDYGWKNSWQHDSRCRVVYNGIDLTRFFEPIDRADVKRELAIPEESTLLIHVGRFDDSKNHARLVSIFSRLRAMDKSAYLLLVGLGGNNSEQSISDMVESLDLEPYVIFAGHRQDIPRLLKASDLMVFPSIREGLPGSVLEACAAGVPVVASDLPGSIEIAERFSTVRCLPLSLDDSIWVETIKNMLEMSKSTASRNEATDLFHGSDFDLNKCVKSFCSIWGTCN
jgi:glycosyltransferase involved in cell wall biosynthesis